MECKICGTTLIFEPTDDMDTAIVWCPNCGRDYSYGVEDENHQSTTSSLISRLKRIFNGREVPSSR